MKKKRLKTAREEFNRYFGIHEKVFKKMVEILKKAEEKQKKFGGRPNKLSIEKRLQMTLQYWREYRSYFAIGRDFGISEASCYKNIQWIENMLIKSGEFNLPNKQTISKDSNLKIVTIDVTESRIERPKRKQKKFILGKRSIIRSKPKQSSMQTQHKSLQQ